MTRDPMLDPAGQSGGVPPLAPSLFVAVGLVAAAAGMVAAGLWMDFTRGFGQLFGVILLGIGGVCWRGAVGAGIAALVLYVVNLERLHGERGIWAAATIGALAVEVVAVVLAVEAMIITLMLAFGFTPGFGTGGVSLQAWLEAHADVYGTIFTECTPALPIFALAATVPALLAWRALRAAPGELRPTLIQLTRWSLLIRPAGFACMFALVERPMRREDWAIALLIGAFETLGYIGGFAAAMLASTRARLRLIPDAPPEPEGRSATDAKPGGDGALADDHDPPA